MKAAVDLLACPACGNDLNPELSCAGCGTRWQAPDGIPRLRIDADARTETVREFYGHAPFPGYPPNDSLAWLRARAGRSAFAKLLDDSIPADARLVEIGCGTGQTSLFLARADRKVVALDLTRASLELGAAAAERYGIEGITFVEADINRLPLKPGAFDLVYCSGVLHHTPDPRASFARIAKAVRPGGMIIIGLYNSIARLPLKARRVVARLTRNRWVPFDPVLRDRESEPERREAWLRDQYMHPEEHCHSVGEVRRWFAENDIEFVRNYPSTVFGDDEPPSLYEPAADAWAPETWAAQLGWMWSLGGEGGLFMSVGRRRS